MLNDKTICLISTHISLNGYLRKWWESILEIIGRRLVNSGINEEAHVYPLAGWMHNIAITRLWNASQILSGTSLNWPLVFLLWLIYSVATDKINRYRIQNTVFSFIRRIPENISFFYLGHRLVLVFSTTGLRQLTRSEKSDLFHSRTNYHNHIDVSHSSRIIRTGCISFGRE